MNKELIQKSKEGKKEERKDERENDCMNDTKDQMWQLPFLADSVSSEDWSPLTLQTLNALLVPCVRVCFSPHADCQVWKITPQFQVMLPIQVPRSALLFISRWMLGIRSGCVPPQYGSSHVTWWFSYAFTLIPRYKFFKVVCQLPKLLREETGSIVPTPPHMKKT